MSTLSQKKGVGGTIWDFMTTVDHKKIAILYLIAGGIFFSSRRSGSAIYTYSAGYTKQ